MVEMSRLLGLSFAPNLNFASFSKSPHDNCIVSQLWPQSLGSLLASLVSHRGVYSFSLATNCLPTPDTDIFTNKY